MNLAGLCLCLLCPIKNANPAFHSVLWKGAHAVSYSEFTHTCHALFWRLFFLACILIKALVLLNTPSPFVHEDEDAELWSSAQVLFSRACVNGARVRHVTQLSHQKYSCSQAGMVGHSFNPSTLETECDVEFLTIATRTNYELCFSYPLHMDVGSRNYGCFVSFCFLLPLFSQMCVLSSVYGGRRTALGVIPPQAPFTFLCLFAYLFC